MKFETEHGCVVSETATAYGNSKQIGRYAIAAAMNEVLTRAERVDQMEIRVCAPLEEKKTHLYDVKAEAARCAREHGQTFWEPEIIRAAWAAGTFVQVNALAADVKQQAWNKETMRAGQDIVLTKWIGLEGTLRILDEKRKELGKRFSGTFLHQVEEFRETIFAEREIRVAKAEACRHAPGWRRRYLCRTLQTAKEADTGLIVDLRAMPVRQETIEICECYKLNPYQLASTGNHIDDM